MTYEKMQSRIDEIRLFQSQHQVHVGRLLATLKRNPNNHESRQELDKRNEAYLHFMEERNHIEGRMRETQLARRAEQEARDNVRQIACALLANPELVENDHAAIVNDAMEIEQLIQALTFRA